MIRKRKKFNAEKQITQWITYESSLIGENSI